MTLADARELLLGPVIDSSGRGVSGFDPDDMALRCADPRGE